LVEEPALEVQDGEEPEQVWRITNRSGETMTITVSEVLHDSAHQLGPDPGLVKDGVEKQLQVLLSERCHVVRPDLQLVRREYPTDTGPVDLLCRDNRDVRRRGGERRSTVSSNFPAISRGSGQRRAPLQASWSPLEFKPQARVLAAERSIGCVQVDYDELRGVESDLLRLF
jgi:RecB family endonuclease NucS